MTPLLRQVIRIIIPEYVANISIIRDKIKESIENLLAETSWTAKKLKARKRINKAPLTIPKQKKHKPFNQKLPQAE